MRTFLLVAVLGWGIEGALKEVPISYTDWITSLTKSKLVFPEAYLVSLLTLTSSGFKEGSPFKRFL